jgi:hypothetical protein
MEYRINQTPLLVQGNREHNNNKEAQDWLERAVQKFERFNIVWITASANFLSTRHIFDNYHKYVIAIKDRRYLMKHKTTENHCDGCLVLSIHLQGYTQPRRMNANRWMLGSFCCLTVSFPILSSSSSITIFASWHLQFIYATFIRQHTNLKTRTGFRSGVGRPTWSLRGPYRGEI